MIVFPLLTGRSFTISSVKHRSITSLQLDPCRRASASGRVTRKRYRWAEQWMMAAKARLFGDQEALASILGADEPLACKKIGRTVRNYDDVHWSSARFDLVVAGNIAKFGQNQPLRDHLLASGDAILVEASPRDQIWGIGFGRDNPAVHDPLRWRGRNLLGFALVKVRAVLSGELVPS